MTKRLAVIGAAVMTTLLALVVLWQFRMVVVYALLALTLAAALRPLMQRLVGRGWVAHTAWLLLYLVALGGFVFLLSRTLGAVSDEIQLMAQTVSAQDKWRLPAWLEGTPFQHALVARLPPPSQLLEAATGSEGQLVLPTILGFTQGLGGAVSGVSIVLFLSIYWGAGQVHFERLWLSLLPSDQRTQARGIWRAIEAALGDDPTMRVSEYAGVLHAAVEAHWPGGDRPRLVVEPGRSIAAPSAVTLYRVGTVKEIPGIGTYVAVDGGMSDNPRPVLYGAGYEAYLPSRVSEARPLRCNIVGKHCEQGDVIVADAQLPAGVGVGDLLATPTTGAYGYSMASNYNKVPRPAVVFVRDGRARLVVRRETPEDLVRLDVV